MRLVAYFLIAAFAMPLCAQADRILKRQAAKTPQEAAKNALDAFTNSDPKIAALGDSYVDGKNVVIGFVNGKAITTQQIKDRMAGQLDSIVEGNLAGYPLAERTGRVRKLVEFQIIFGRAARSMFDEILDTEAKASGLSETAMKGNVDLLIESMKTRAGIARGDTETWAKFLLQEFRMTPLEFHKDRLKLHMRSQAHALMAGEHGPIRGLKLPLYLPLEVTPSEIRRRFNETKDDYKKSEDIKYSALGLKFPTATSSDDKVKMQAIMMEARKRVVAGEAISDVVKNYIKPALKEQEIANLPGLSIIQDAETKADSDADLEEIGQLTRGIEVGEHSRLSLNIQLKEKGSDLTAFVFTTLLARKITETRKFADPVVQKEIKAQLRAEKVQRNRKRVERVLVRRAVLFPRNLLGAGN